MTNPEILFLALRLLEKKPLTAEQLWLRAAGEGPERSMKTFRRALADLEDFGMPVIKKDKTFSLPEKSVLSVGFTAFLKCAIEMHAAWRTICYGDIDRKAVADILGEKSRPVELMWQLVDAVVNSKRIEFLYTPQHLGTRENLRWVRPIFRIGTPPDRMPVSMLPHYLVFSGQHFLVLGEGTIAGDAYVRQYEIAGIAEINVRTPEQKQLRINPAELYQHSLRVWVGGEIHEVEIENITEPEGGTKKIKVNGEDEILSYVIGSLGKLRIVNPPEAIRRRAEQLGLPEDMVFKFTDK
ncbi:MAG: hypothetical protein KF713_13375 [Turneriella sp.]|nr:hypothetical protein [Turneriella sp.]